MKYINIEKLQEKLQTLYPAHEIEVSSDWENSVSIFINRRPLEEGLDRTVEKEIGGVIYQINLSLNANKNGTNLDFALRMLDKLVAVTEEYLKFEANFNKAEAIDTLKEIQGKLENLIPQIPEELEYISYDDYTTDYSLSRALNNIKKIKERIENGN